MTSAPALRNRSAYAVDNRVISLSFAAINACQSWRASGMIQPWPRASSSVRLTSAAYTSSFFGTHPRITQVPPQRSASATAVRAPCSAATRAARTPPEPPPITNRSRSNRVINTVYVVGPAGVTVSRNSVKQVCRCTLSSLGRACCLGSGRLEEQPMRIRFGIALVALWIGAGCSTSSTPEAWQASPDAGSAATDAGMLAERLGFEIVTPTVPVQPNSEITYCYYFQTSNTAEVAVRRWTSQMSESGQQMILFLTP